MSNRGAYQRSGRRLRAGKPAIALGLAAGLVLSGCGARQGANDKILFDGHRFRTSAKVVDKKVSRADFTVTVNDASASLDGAREAGRYAGTVYCIEKFGTSRINWSVGPDTDPQQLRIVDNKLNFAGSCQRP